MGCGGCPREITVVVSGADPSARELDRRNWPPRWRRRGGGTPGSRRSPTSPSASACQTNGVRRRPRRPGSREVTARALLRPRSIRLAAATTLSLCPRSLTTVHPIYYVTAAPHIGSAYTTVAGDVLTRCTPSGRAQVVPHRYDEHGEKVMRALRRRACPRRSDGQAGRRGLEAGLGSTSTSTTTTSSGPPSSGHRAVRESGRRFTTAVTSTRASTRACTASAARSSSLPRTSARPRRHPAVHDPRHELETVSRRTTSSGSRVRRRLLELYESQPDFVAPASARNEVISFVKQGCRTCPSPGHLRLGIPVPWTRTTSSTWIDALLN